VRGTVLLRSARHPLRRAHRAIAARTRPGCVRPADREGNLRAALPARGAYPSLLRSGFTPPTIGSCLPSNSSLRADNARSNSSFSRELAKLRAPCCSRASRNDCPLSGSKGGRSTYRSFAPLSSAVRPEASQDTTERNPPSGSNLRLDPF
jgi:hypothetical protein